MKKLKQREKCTTINAENSMRVQVQEAGRIESVEVHATLNKEFLIIKLQ